VTKENSISITDDYLKFLPALSECVSRWTEGKNLYCSEIESLTFHRWSHPTEPTSYTLGPNICLIAQGAKRVVLGEEVYDYDAHNFLLASVDLPIVAQVLEATPEVPYLGITLELDLKIISQLMVDSNVPSPYMPRDNRGIAVSPVSGSLLAAFKRLIALLDTPEHIPALAPLIQREIYYWLLVGEQGGRLRQIVSAGSHGNQIAKAIDWIKKNFDKPFQIKDLAADVWMSTSSFHKQFRFLTAMTPLQYQKKMRLNEARRLMLVEYMDAADAAFQVGYESPSQFSREYNRMFGAPPLRDIKRLRELSDMTPCEEG
jgi:AraC-like DNA-binding protein